MQPIKTLRTEGLKMHTRGISQVNKTLLLFYCAAAFCVCELGSACLLVLLSLYQVLDLNLVFFFFN